MSKKSLTSNYIYNFLYQLLIIIIPVILIPFLSRTLKPEGTGLYSYTNSIVAYFSLAALLGVQLYGTKTMASVQDNQEEVRVNFCGIFILKMITSGIAIIAFLISLIFLDNKLLYAIQGLILIANLLDITWFFTGTERFKTILVRNVIVKTVSLVLILICVKSTNDVWIYALILIGSEFLGQILMWLDFNRYKMFDNFRDSLRKLALLKHFKGMLILFLPQAIIMLYTSLNITMIGLLSNTVEVGYYDMSDKIINTLLVVVNSLSMVMIPRISKLFVDGNKKEINETLGKAVNVMSYLSYPITVGISLVSSILVPWFLGNDFIPAIVIVSVFAFKIILVQFSNVIGTQYLIPTNQNKRFTISVLSGAIVNLGLNFIFIPLWGALGATIGMLASEVAVTIMQFVLTRKDVPFVKFVAKTYKSFISATLMGIAVYICIKYLSGYNISFISRFISIEGIVTGINMVIHIMIGVVVYLFSNLVLKNPIQSMIVYKVRSILKINKRDKAS